MSDSWTARAATPVLASSSPIQRVDGRHRHLRTWRIGSATGPTSAYAHAQRTAAPLSPTWARGREYDSESGGPRTKRSTRRSIRTTTATLARPRAVFPADRAHPYAGRTPPDRSTTRVKSRTLPQPGHVRRLSLPPRRSRPLRCGPAARRPGRHRACRSLLHDPARAALPRWYHAHGRGDRFRLGPGTPGSGCRRKLPVAGRQVLAPFTAVAVSTTSDDGVGVGNGQLVVDS